MSSAFLGRARALGLALAIALFALAVLVPAAYAAPNPVAPAAMTVTVVLDKSSYLSGDTATAMAVVYRTPAPGNYTYTWRVRDAANRIINTTTNAAATFVWPIPLDYTGTIRFEATVDDGQGTVVASQQSANVALAFMALALDRGEFNPGETINAFYSVTSHVITRPTYAYTVTDTTGTTVLSGTTNETFFSFRAPNPASRSYTFRVTATDRGNSTQAQVTISQAGGFVLGVTFDKPTYAPGDTVHAHLTLTARGTAALPSQFRWALVVASVSASAITTRPSADLYLTIPAGAGTGGLLVIATEASTGTTAFQTLQVGAPANALWSTELAGVPLFAVVLGVLFLLLLFAVVGLWRRVGGGRIGGPGMGMAGKPAPPPPPEGPVRASAATPMSITCRHCGKPIDLTTSKRPIEVMCPSCGETQLVT